MIERNIKIRNLFKLILLIVCLSILSIYSWMRIKMLVSNAAEDGDVRYQTSIRVGGGVSGPSIFPIKSYAGSSFGGGELHYEDLEGKQYILCREHHTLLRENGEGYWLRYQGTDVNGTIVTADGHEALTVSSESFSTLTEADGKPPSIYMVGENQYWSEGTNSANPMEAYVLAHVGNKSGHPSKEQKAWWNTENSGSDNIVRGWGGWTDLSTKALDFQNFVIKAGGNTGGSNGFEIPAPSWSHPDAKVSVKYENDKFIIGPFGINYVQYITSEEYGIMDSLTLITDKCPDGVGLGNGWWIIDGSGNAISNPNAVPEGGADFYVVIPYANGHSDIVDKKIMNMTSRVRYMNGKGSYEKLRGNYTFRMYKVGSTRSDSVFINPEHFRGVGKPTMRVRSNITNKFPQLRGSSYEDDFACEFDKDGNIWIIGPDGDKYERLFGDPGEGVYQIYQEVHYNGISTCEKKEPENFLEQLVQVLYWTSPEVDEDNPVPQEGKYAIYWPGNPPPDTITNPVIDPSQIVSFPDRDEYENYEEGDEYVISDYATGWIEVTDEFLSNYPPQISDPDVTDIYEADYGGEGVYSNSIDLQYGNCKYNDTIDSKTETYWIFGRSADYEEIIENESDDCGAVVDTLREPLLVIGQINNYPKDNPELWQCLNAAIDGSLWYEVYDLSMKSTLYDTKLSIEKEMKDPNGNDIDVNIPFNLHVDGSTIIRYEDKLLSVNPKSSTPTDSQVFYYTNKAGLRFNLTEMIDTDDERYKDYRITKVTATNVKGEDITGDISYSNNVISGDMKQNLLKLHIVNEASPNTESGKLRLDKKIDIPNLPPNDSNTQSNTDNSYFIKDKRFAFKVTIAPGNKSSFKYGGKTYVDSDILEQYKKIHPGETVVAGNCEFVMIVKARDDNTTITSENENDYMPKTGDITWYKNTEKPSYTVEEIMAEDLKDENIKTQIRNAPHSSQSILDEIIRSADCSYGNVVQNGNGYLSSDCEYISVSSKNTQDTEKGKIKILKRLNLQPYKDLGMNSDQIRTYIDQQIANNEFDFKFKVRVGNEDEKLITLVSSGAYRYVEGDIDEYRWTWESEEYEWLKGNELPYTITEVTSPNDISEPTVGDLRTGILSRAKDGEVIENYSYTQITKGAINNGTQDEVIEVTNYFENKPKIDSFSISISKKMDEKTFQKLKGKDIHFVVNLDGWFKYGENEQDKHGKRRVRITNADGGSDVLRDLFDVDDSTELKEQRTNENEQYITLHVPDGAYDNRYNTEGITKWESLGIFYLPNAHDLKIMIYEDRSNLGDEIISTLKEGIEPGVWVDVDNISFVERDKNISVIYDNSYNDDKTKFAYLKIHKIVEGASTLSDEEIEKLKFTFKVKAIKKNIETEGYEVIFDKFITLDKKNFDSKLNTWEWVDPTPISWNPDEYETPIYTIYECEDLSSDSIKFSNCWSAGSYEIIDENAEFKDKMDELLYGNDYENAVKGLFAENRKSISIEKRAVAGKVVEKEKSEASVSVPTEDGKEENKTKGTDEYSETNDVYFKNTTEQLPNEGYIRLHKEIATSNLEDAQYAFLIKFTGGKFKLAGNEKEYEPKTNAPLYLTADNTLVEEAALFTADGHLNPEKAIIVNVAKGETISETWESSVFKWDGDNNAPEYTIGTDNTNPNKPIYYEYKRSITTDNLRTEFVPYVDESMVIVSNGTEENSDALKTKKDAIKGKLLGEVTFGYQNGIKKPYSAKLKIRKKIAHSDITNNADTNGDLEKYLKNLKFGFNINFEGSRSVDTYAKYLEYTNGFYIYETDEIQEYIDENGSIDYQVVETSMPEGFAFEKWIRPDGTENDSKVYTGQLKASEASLITIEAKNKLGGKPSKARLQIVKENLDEEISGGSSGSGSSQSYALPVQDPEEPGLTAQSSEEAEIEKTLWFTVKISVPNGAKNVKYILDGKVVELAPGDYFFNNKETIPNAPREELTNNPNNRVKIEISKKSGIWNSEGIIVWDEGGKAPEYTITEPGYHPIYNGSNQGTLSEAIDNLLTIYLDNTSIDGDSVQLQINKESTNGSNENKTFKFKVEVEGYETRYVTITTDNSGKGSKKLNYTLPDGKNILTYKVTEVEIPLGSSFVEMYEEGNDANKVVSPSQELTGKLTTSKNIVVICKNNDSPGPSKSALYIKKTGVKKGKYDFKVRIVAKNGVSITGGVIGNKYIEPGHSFEKELNIDLDDNSVAFIGDFEWAGGQDGAPNYSVEEIESPEVYSYPNYASKVRLINGSGVLTGNTTTVVTQENEVNKTGGYIKFTKGMLGNVKHLEKKYKFAVYIYDPHETRKTSEATPILKYENIEIGLGETWTSDYIEWEKDFFYNGDKGKYEENLITNAPRYYIKEIGATPEDNTAKFDEDFSKLNSIKPVEVEITKKEDEEEQTFNVNRLDMKSKLKVNGVDEIFGDQITNGIEGKLNWGILRIRKEVATYKAGLPPNSNFEIRLAIKSNGVFRFEDDPEDEWRTEYTREYNNPVSLTHHTAAAGGTEDPWTRKIIWPVDSEPPTVSVEEINLENVAADGGEWQLVGISNNNKGLIKGKTLEIVVNNEYNAIQQLFYKIGGDVWVDRPNEENKSISEPEGLMDAIRTGTKSFVWSNVEEKLANVEVYVYKAGTKDLVKLYTETGGEIKQPILTDENGHWGASIMLSDIGGLDRMYVAYVYDGQTYEPTNVLTRVNSESLRSNGGVYDNDSSAAEYRNANYDAKKLWQFGSMAKDVETASGNDLFGKYNRSTSQKKMNKIQGNTPMDRYGNTIGTAIGSDGTKRNLYYTSNIAEHFVDSKPGFAEKAVSTLSTTNKDGTVRDEFKVVATTEEVGLTFPFDNHLVLTDKSETKFGKVYVAGYPYSQHINLGLKERKKANLVAVKDLDSAIVVVDGRMETYKFNTLEASVKQKLANSNIENGKLKELYDSNDANTLIYTLDLFKTDYFYRAELYQTGKNYDKLYSFYKSIMDIKSTEMEVYLTYKYSVYNESTYYTKVYTLDDYYDESLELVTNNVERLIRNKNGKEQTYSKTTVVNTNDVPATDGNEGRKMLINNGTTISPNVRDGTNPTKMYGSDGHVYNKVTFKLKDSNTYSTENTNIWKPGEIKKYYATFRVSKGNVDNIADSVIMGTQKESKKDKDDKGNDIVETIIMDTKSNIFEIGSYSTGKLNGDKFNSLGKVDYNSAPSNVNIQEYNTESRYEDDTYRVKTKLKFAENSKTISGKAWEDKKTSDGNGLGDGMYDTNNEALIGGLTTELVEKLKIDNQEYDFLWPTDRKIDSLGGKTFEELTGFDSTLETSRVKDEKSGKSVGSYKFENVPTGNYIVRFKYGDKKETQLDETIALDKEGKQWSTDSNAGVYTANYYGKKYGQTPAVYNGQDYKTTIYHSEIADDYNNNDARDNEARRLEVMSNSQTITNSNGSDMYEANKASGNHEVLNEKYSMFADSDKIIIPTNIKESDNDISGTYENWSIKPKVIEYKKMSVDNLDAGLIERPENRIVLDKEISSIRLTTNDGKLLFNAVYDIDFTELEENKIDYKDGNKHVIIARTFDNNKKYLVVNKILNKNKSTGIEMMQALDKIENKLEYEGALNAGVQNFRFINVDNDILQGMNVELNYKVYALNVGEKDYTSTAIKRLSGERDAADLLHQMSEIISDENNIHGNYKYGEYDKYIDFNKNDTDKKIKIVDKKSDKKEENANQFNIGLGKYYYSGNVTNEELVSTRIREVLDYIDTDAVFETESNKVNDHYWKNISVAELDGNGNLGNRLISMLKSNVDTILDKDQRQYVTSTQNNLAVNVDVIDKGASINNGEFEKELYPYSDANYNSIIDITAIKRTSSEDDADSMAYDNLVEILKYENSVGRRDMTTIPGDVSPKLGEFVTSLEERDASSTELITFTPPTGIIYEDVMTNQLLVVIASAFSIVVVGVVIIKKKVIKK